MSEKFKSLEGAVKNYRDNNSPAADIGQFILDNSNHIEYIVTTLTRYLDAAKADLEWHQETMRKLAAEKQQKRDEQQFIAMGKQIGDVYRCPNTNQPIACATGDDKVICKCGQPNPNIKASQQRIWENEQQLLQMGVGLHYAKFLERC